MLEARRGRKLGICQSPYLYYLQCSSNDLESAGGSSKCHVLEYCILHTFISLTPPSPAHLELDKGE